jgi:hypothetical protein
MKAVRHLEKQAQLERKTAARARRTVQLVVDQQDRDRIRGFANECDDRAAALEYRIRSGHRSKGRSGT